MTMAKSQNDSYGNSSVKENSDEQVILLYKWQVYSYCNVHDLDNKYQVYKYSYDLEIRNKIFTLLPK